MNAQQEAGAPLQAQPPLDHADLLERDAEVAVIDDLVSDASRGGRLLVIEGPAGIGKSSLIAESKARAQRSGMQVLSARGSELEREFSYGVVRQLFEPRLTSLAADETEQLFTGASALAKPLFDPAQLAGEHTGDFSLATLHGLYWLTANIAGQQPLVLTIDDLHWCDLSSLRWLAYLLPRMEDVAVSVVVGLRPAEAVQDPGLVSQIVSDRLAAVIRPAPLSADATTRLVRDALTADADDAFCVACHEETGGNPLLVRELVSAIAAEGVPASAVATTHLHELAARAGSRAVTVRLSRVPAEATRLAQAVAVLGDAAEPRHAATLAGLDERTSSEMAGALAQVDVLRPQPPLGFVHPLIRAAVYESVPPVERDSAHARAAQILQDTGAEPERVAAHLLLAAPAGDPQVVDILRQAARHARSRGASESAAAYLARALAEPPAAADRAAVLRELGSVEALVSGDAAVEHLREAYGLLTDPVSRAETALLLGRQLLLLFRVDQSVAFYREALDELAGGDAELERRLEAGLLNNLIFLPSLQHEATERLERARRQQADTTVGEKMLLSLLAFHDARGGASAAAAVPLARRALAGGTLVAEEVSGENPAATFVLPAYVLAMADLDDALTVYEDALAAAHQRGSILAFTGAKVLRAHTLLWRGDLAEAEGECRGAFAAGDAWGSSWRPAVLLSALFADSLMEQGKLDEATAALARTQRGEFLADGGAPVGLRDSRARLRMLRGDVAGGLEALLDVGRSYEAVGGRNPAFLPWRSQAALALLQLGDRDEAQRLVNDELEDARAWGAPRALGTALRAAGVIAGGRQGLTLLEEAVEVLADSPAKLEHAKARTDLGAALRRANQRAAAREHLRRALELATICGAAPLAERAKTELLATGARPRRIALSGVESLTPSERRVARMAAEGRTNRDIAQTLFITTRTVEVHLSSVYRKLRITSRGQLDGALAEAARP